jgi:DNA relaxase NicK
VPAVSRNAYKDAGHVLLQNGRRPKRSLIINSEGGSTCYIGSRVSENFGRVYDKGRESETAPAGALWRWECELKGSLALAAAKQLLDYPDPLPAILSYVTSWWERRCSVRLADATNPLTLVVSPSDRTTDEVRLAWLQSSIRPCIRRLVESVGRERVLAALGLLPQSAVASHLPASTHEVAEWLSQSVTSIS